jgi:hypothetical protein
MVGSCREGGERRGRREGRRKGEGDGDASNHCWVGSMVLPVDLIKTLDNKTELDNLPDLRDIVASRVNFRSCQAVIQGSDGCGERE